MKKIANFLLLALVIVVDRLTKWWAFKTLFLAPWPVCYGLNFVLSWNRGISWSLFATNNPYGYWTLTALIIATIATFAGYVWWRATKKLPITFEMLVLGGALSNVIDRFWYGAVLDFIELYVGQWYWPVFNIADSMVVVGVCGILTRAWLGRD